MSKEVKDIQTESTANSQTSSYRSIFKATSLFGGVQVYQILIRIIASKFIAVLLGPYGVGIKDLYQSSLKMIQSLTSMGISRSAVRDVSLANGTGDKKSIGKTVTALRKLVWITGFLGLIVTIIFSPILSKTAFGNYDYTLPFIFLSIILLLEQLSAGQLVVLQGMRRLKYMAKASTIGVTVGLFVSIPLYYLLGVRGIVPTLILNAITSLALSWYFSKKVKIEKVEMSNKEAFEEGKTMLRMGIVMSVSSVLAWAFAYALRSFIRVQGDIETVGIFTAGFVIMNTYVGLIFDAMIKDFYPRLSAVSEDNGKCKLLVNQQVEIASLIMAPMLIACLVFMPIVIWILYSDKFLGAIDYIIWAIPGMFFKLMSWAVSLVFVAKGASKQYISNEVFGAVANFVCSILGFYYLGLKGLGVGFTVGYLIYLVKVWVTASRKYQFSFLNSFWKLDVMLFLLVLICIAVVLTENSLIKYSVGIVLLIVSLYISFKGVNDRTGVLNIIKQRMKKQ